MKVEVRLYSELKRYAPGDNNIFILTLSPGATVADVLAKLNIPSSVHRMIILNGRRAADDSLLEPGDTLVLFTPACGG